MSTNKDLSAAEAQKRPVYHLIHASNVPIVFDEGYVRAHGYGGTPYPKQIWSPEFIRARGQRTVPFGARDSLHSFVPFTFCARTPAAYNIATGYNGTVRRPNTELMFLRTTPRRLLEALVPLVTCDRMPLKRGSRHHRRHQLDRRAGLGFAEVEFVSRHRCRSNSVGSLRCRNPRLHDRPSRRA